MSSNEYTKPIKLTATEIAKRLDIQGEYRTEEPGVALRVGKRKVSLSIRRRVDGKAQRINIELNPYNLPNKIEMRRLIDGARHEQVETKSHLSLQECGVTMIEAKAQAGTIGAGTEKNYWRHLKYLVPATADRFPDKAADIVETHRDLWEEHGPAGANDAIKFLGSVVGYARASDLPAPEWPKEKLKRLGLYAKLQPRDSRLTKDNFAQAWNADLPEEWRKWLHFALLTAMRRDEIRRTYIKGSRVYIDGLTKNGTTHSLPLTDSIRACWMDFSDRADARKITELLEAAGVYLTPHGCRRTFKSAAREAGVSDSVSDFISNHIQEDTVANRYRGDPSDDVICDALHKIEMKYKEWGAIF